MSLKKCICILTGKIPLNKKQTNKQTTVYIRPVIMLILPEVRIKLKENAAELNAP